MPCRCLLKPMAVRGVVMHALVLWGTQPSMHGRRTERFHMVVSAWPVWSLSNSAMEPAAPDRMLSLNGGSEMVLL